MVQAGVGGLDTPRTTNGDATYLSNPQLDFDISQEQSFQSPSKDNNNLLQQLQNGRRGINLKTPRSRVALNDRRNLPAGLGGGEFTPLLKSATRNSALRLGKENIPATPAFGGLGNIPEDLTPLPAGSSVYGASRNGSYFASTPAPILDSSSTASTPMALLPRQNEGPGVLQDGNQLSLREQENVIDRIEKENFGLKLKIHFLEEALHKAGPGFSEAALKENTELKVDKVTMQRELLRYRKTLGTAERDLELYKQQFADMQEKMKHRNVDDGQKEEMERLRLALEDRDAEIDLLKSREHQFEDLQDKVHDLEADLREKDRLIDDRDDDIENLKDEQEKHTNTIAELETSIKNAQRRNLELEENAQVSEELEDAKETIQELEHDLKRAQNEVQEAKEDRDEAVKEKERAASDLEELQDEMANKSITTKGLSRQIEEKANRLQDDLEELREKHITLQEQYASKERETKQLESTIDQIRQQVEVREEKLKDKLDLAINEKAILAREKEALSNQLESAQKDLQQRAGDKDSISARLISVQREHQQKSNDIESLSKRLEAAQREIQQKTNESESISKQFENAQRDLQQRTDEKSLLQIRHDALTTESASLQRELANSRKMIEDLEDKLDHEKTLALNNEREVRDQYKTEIDRLHDEVEDLRAEVREKERLFDDGSDKWDSERRSLQSQKSIAEEKAASLQRAIDRLQDAEGSLSSKESKLQQALQSENERHASQEAILTREVKDLTEDIQVKQKALEEVRSDLTNVREELRLSQRERKSLAEKLEGLEDEVEILQNSLDDESEQANQEISAAKVEAESFRRQVIVLKQDLARAEAATADAQALVEAFQGDLEAGEGNEEQLGARLRQVEAQLTRVRQEKQELQGQLAKVNIEVHSLRTSKADIESELAEIKVGLQERQQHDEETFRLDQERMDLRAAKLKLDGEVRRLREENKLADSRQKTLESELQEEIDRAAAEESRLNTEIHDLQRILRGSAEKRELAAAKKTIQQLEQRVCELEIQVASGEGETDAANELSIIRRDLSTARQKEKEYIQREATQKSSIRDLKREVAELQRQAHESNISNIAGSSPHSSVSGSARKSELFEVRAQLATAHQTIKEVRTQLKDIEKEANRKVNSVNLELQAQVATWETEKDEFERSLDQAQYAKEELQAKNAASEATVSRLRNKIDRLEKALAAERANTGEDRTMVAERRDLHEMLRETQIQVETLELVVQERDNTIATISAAEAQLRFQLNRVRNERASWRNKATSSHEQLEHFQRKYRKAKEDITRAKEDWEAEKKTLTRGVRFPNMSISYNEEQLEVLKQDQDERNSRHEKEMRGMSMQLEWLKAKCKREEGFRDAAAYAKKYMALQIELFEACNKHDLDLLRSGPIPVDLLPPLTESKRKPTIRKVALAVRAWVRMRMGAQKWAEKRKIDEKLQKKVEEMRTKNFREAMAIVNKGRSPVVEGRTQTPAERVERDFRYIGPRSSDPVSCSRPGTMGSGRDVNNRRGRRSMGSNSTSTRFPREVRGEGHSLGSLDL